LGIEKYQKCVVKHWTTLDITIGMMSLLTNFKNELILTRSELAESSLLPLVITVIPKLMRHWHAMQMFTYTQ